MFIVQGYYVCKTAWMVAYGVGKSMFTSTYQSFKTGVVILDRETDRRLTHKSVVARSWMQMTFNRIGDIMPDSLTIHLPSYLNNKMLYDYMKTDLGKQDDTCISYSQFCSLWATQFHDVRIPKVR